MFNLRKSYWFMLFIYVLTCTPLTIPLCAMAKGTINQPHTKMIFLKPEVRRQPDAFRIDLPEPIMRSPIVMSFYSLSGVRVFEQTLVLDTPALAIELGVLSEQLARLPTGYYFYDLQARGSVVGTQWSDSLLFRDISASNLPAETTVASFSRFGDLNGDSFVDLVLSRAFALGQPQLFINDGSGRFADETADRWPTGEFFTKDIELLDVDLDGDLDIFFVAEDTNSVITESDGTCGFLPVPELPQSVQPHYHDRLLLQRCLTSTFLFFDSTGTPVWTRSLNS